MSADDHLNRGTRNMIQSTVKTIAQLKEDMRLHVEQEVANVLHIETLSFNLMEAKQRDTNIKMNIAAIRQSIAQLEEVEQNLRRTLSPMKHLPSEVLLYIFRILVESTDYNRQKRAERRRWGSTADRYLPLRLGRVCRRWRAIVTMNLLLWRTVEARLQQDSEEAMDQEEQRLAHWTRAQRTAEQTLFINNWDVESNGFLCKLVGAIPAKWKAISISAPPDAAGSWDLNMLYADEVTIRRPNPVGTTYFTPLMRRASSLIMYGPPPEWGVLPWIHLRSLLVKEFTSTGETPAAPLRFGRADFATLLLAAGQLSELTVDFRANETALLSADSPTISHANLSSFSLHLHHFVEGVGPFGVVLSAPSLQKLDFISLRCNAPTDSSPFVCSDHPTVVSLPIMDDNEVLLAAELSKWLPDVHTIEVSGQTIDTLFVFLHTMLHHVPPLSFPLPFPKLRSVFITDTDLRGETLIELLEGRLRHVRGNTVGMSAVVDVRIYNSPGVTAVHWARVEELLKEGLRDMGMINGDGMIPEGG